MSNSTSENGCIITDYKDAHLAVRCGSNNERGIDVSQGNTAVMRRDLPKIAGDPERLKNFS